MIPNRQIGQSVEATNTWYVAKAVERLIEVTAATPATGAASSSSPVSGNPVYVAGKVVPSTLATVDAGLVEGDAAGAPITTGNQLAVKPFGTAELDFTTFVSTVSTVVTVQGLAPASGVASVRNYITGLTINTDALGAVGLLWVLDGALTISSVAITTGLATTSTAHNLKIGDAFVFTAIAGGTGLSVNTIYYVRATPSPTTFNFSTTILGANTVPSVAYTGTTGYRLLFQFRLQTTAIGVPTTVTFPTPLRGAPNVTTNFLIPTSMTSGNIYLTANGYKGF
jgi:hypothetical protein